jgi:hypothetical protein
MNYSPSRLQLPQKPWADRLQAFIEVLLLSGLVSSFLAALIFAAMHGKNVKLLETNANVVSLFLLLESGITFILLAIILKTHQESISGLGLRWIRWKSNLFIGLSLAPLLLLVNGIVGVIFRLICPIIMLNEIR